MAYPFILYSNIDDTPTATSEATDIENAFDLRTYVRWQATTSGDQNIDFDAGAAVDVDALGIAGHNLGTASASVVVKSSATGAFAGEETTRLASFDPADDSVITKSFTSASARYWRITLSGMSATPEIGVINLGERMDFPSGIKQPMDFMNESMEMSEEVSKGGHLLGATTRYRPYTFSATFVRPSYSWVTNTFYPFWENHGSLHKPFFFSVDSAQSFDGRFVRFPENFSLQYQMVSWDYLDTLRLSFEGIL